MNEAISSADTVIIGIEQDMHSMPMSRYETDEAAGFDLCSARNM